MLIEASTPLYQDRRLEELPHELLARVADIGATASYGAHQSTTPENTGVVSLSDNLRGAAGHSLPEVDWLMEQRKKWLKTDSPLGFLAASTEISLTTGCWSVLDAWRDDKGYVFIDEPEQYGLDREIGFGYRSHKLAYILLKRDRDPYFEIPPRTDLDHTCRFTGCCNPYHIEEVTKLENNRRQRIAHDLENALSAGQHILTPNGREWMDVPAEAATNEDINVLVNTSNGPFRVLKVDEKPVMLRGERLEDELLAKLKPPSVRSNPRPSRAKKHKPMEGENPIFIMEASSKRKPTAKKLYKQAMEEA